MNENVVIERAVKRLQEIFGWKRINPDETFDRLARRLRGHTCFRDLSLLEVDLILADARREFERAVDEFEWQIVQAFMDAENRVPSSGRLH